MSRVVLVSNRVLDLSKAARAGGVAVVLANIVRTRKALWFGWNGEVKPAGADGCGRARGTHRHRSALGHRVRRLLPWLRQLGAVAGVPQPPRPRASSRPASSSSSSTTNRRLAALLQPMLRADDIIWVHDYHLIPFAAELRRRGVSEPDRLLSPHSVPALADVHGRPRAPRACADADRLRSHRLADQGGCRQPARLHVEWRSMAVSCRTDASGCSSGSYQSRASQSASI